MGLFETLGNLLTGRKYGDLSQAQTEAFIDALTFVMVVDETVDVTEEARLDDALDEMEWKGQQPLETYVEDAIEEARAIAEDDETNGEAYLEDIRERLDDQSLREQVYYVAAQIAYADDAGIIESERQLLQKLVESFEIDSDRLNLMTDELRKNM